MLSKPLFTKMKYRRSSVKKGVLRNLTKFTRKHLKTRARVSYLIKLQALAKKEKKRPWHRCFPENFVKFPRTLFFIEHLWATASEEYT